jgi:alginate O-acetyltransferase complex protein AlgI
MMAICAVIVWTFPQAWDWTRRLSWARVAACAGAFWLALVALETQSFNPFIYFIF